MKSTRICVAYRCVTVILSAILVVASLSLTGCSFHSLIPSDVNQNQNQLTTTGGGNKATAPSNGTAGTLSAGQTNKPLLPSYCNPLTGLISPTDMSAVRPVAVCIGNTEASPSPYGISSAEILIEAPVEDGTTRLVALTNTYTEQNEIGPIRSSRSYLLSLANIFGAVSVFDGTSDNGIKQDTSAFSVLNRESETLSTVFYRNSSLFAPHNLFTSGTRLLGAMESFEKQGARAPFAFAEEETVAVPNGGSAGGVAVPFSSKQVVQFIYNKESNLYMRSQNGTPHTDALSGEQLGYTNLLLLICESSTYNKVTGTELDLNLSDGGRGYYMSAGGYVEILWSRDKSGALLLTDAAGSPLTVNRGKTYIGLIDLVVSPSVIIVE